MKFPEKIEVVEVGPRDGFQSISQWIPTPLKLQIIQTLIKANFKKIEVTSFVSPKAIAQMKDAKDIMKDLLSHYENRDCIFNALVPNLFGAKAAYTAGVDEITYVVSASNAHNKANVKRSREESFAELMEIKKEFPSLKINLAIATVFGCPFDGDVPINETKWMIENALKAEVDEICLADTIGIANPLQMENIIRGVKESFPNVDFALHLHDTRGMGLANVVVAMQNGISKFESAIGGLGGCPFAPGAAGNIASEDLVNMLHSMGIKTDINLDVLMGLTTLIKEEIKPVLTSHMAYVKRGCKV